MAEQADDVIARKLANALIQDAETSVAARAVSPSGTGWVIERMKRAMGGLWVGGAVSLTRDALLFAPNAVNRAAHAGDTSWAVPLARVTEVADRFGWVTRIVDVHRDDGATFTFRCFGAPAFAGKIRRAAERARSG